MKTQVLPTKFSVLDPDIALVAYNAAYELERHVKGKQTDLPSVKNLSDLLSTVTKTTKGTSSLARMNSLSIDGLNMAYSISHSKQLTTLTELADAIAEILKIFNKLFQSKQKPREEEILSISKFCIALADYSVSLRASLRDTQASHPERR